MAWNREPTRYVLPVSMKPDDAGWVMWTKPALHVATAWPSPVAPAWVVSYGTLPTPRVQLYANEAQARYEAARTIGRLGGEQMRELFSGAQRTAMGAQLCPLKTGDGLCSRPAGVGTVWCLDHPGGNRA